MLRTHHAPLFPAPKLPSVACLGAALGCLALPLAARPQAVEASAAAVTPDVADFRPLLTDGALPPEVLGFWKTRGYGWLVDLRDASPEVYDHGPAGTIPQTEDYAGFLAATSYRMRGETLQLTTSPGSSTVYTWDRVTDLPEGWDTPPSPDPLSTFDYFCAIFAQHYAYFDVRGIDWPARIEQHRPRVGDSTTEEELWDVLCDMLRGFADDHMSLEGTVDGLAVSFDEGYSDALDPALEAAYASKRMAVSLQQFKREWRRQYTLQIREDLLQGEFEVIDGGQVTWGRIGPLGYVSLRGMGGFVEAEDPQVDATGARAAFDRVLADLADTEGLILDITMNTGGYDEVQMAIASHFADRSRVVFQKRPLDVPDAPLQSFVLVPSPGVRYLKPVSLVTSDFTVSAGEDFTLAMKTLPHVTHRGTTTRGAFSDVLTKRLPNGWSVSLSNEAYLDVDGRNFEGLGVPPDDPLPIFVEGSVETSHVDAIYAVADRMLGS